MRTIKGNIGAIGSFTGTVIFRRTALRQKRMAETL
jgi:hypothetical protein